MAVLKSLKQKSREYAFEAFGNAESDSPAKIIFSRFPLPDETYPFASQESVLASSFAKNFDGSAESKERLVNHIIDTMVENIASNRTDFKKFFGECVERVEDLVYDVREIKTPAPRGGVF